MEVVYLENLMLLIVRNILCQSHRNHRCCFHIYIWVVIRFIIWLISVFIFAGWAMFQVFFFSWWYSILADWFFFSSAFIFSGIVLNISGSTDMSASSTVVILTWLLDGLLYFFRFGCCSLWRPSFFAILKYSSLAFFFLLWMRFCWWGCFYTFESSSNSRCSPWRTISSCFQCLLVVFQYAPVVNKTYDGKANIAQPFLF